MLSSTERIKIVAVCLVLLCTAVAGSDTVNIATVSENTLHTTQVLTINIPQSSPIIHNSSDQITQTEIQEPQLTSVINNDSIHSENFTFSTSMHPLVTELPGVVISSSEVPATNTISGISNTSNSLWLSIEQSSAISETSPLLSIPMLPDLSSIITPSFSVSRINQTEPVTTVSGVSTILLTPTSGITTNSINLNQPFSSLSSDLSSLPRGVFYTTSPVLFSESLLAINNSTYVSTAYLSIDSMSPSNFSSLLLSDMTRNFGELNSTILLPSDSVISHYVSSSVFESLVLPTSFNFTLGMTSLSDSSNLEPSLSTFHEPVSQGLSLSGISDNSFITQTKTPNSENLSPSPSESLSPSHSESLSPSPSKSLSPSPDESLSPSPSKSLSPSPNESLSPSPSESLSPNRSDSLLPSQTNSAPSSSVTAGIKPTVTVPTLPQKDQSEGLSTGGKVAIGIIIPIAIIGLIILGVLFYRRYRIGHMNIKDFLQARVRYRTYTNDTYSEDEVSLGGNWRKFSNS